MSECSSLCSSLGGCTFALNSTNGHSVNVWSSRLHNTLVRVKGCFLTVETLIFRDVICTPTILARFGLGRVPNSVYRNYLCIMRSFFVKLTFKFEMHIIHGSHCLPKFSLAYCKQKLLTSWFSITLIKKLPVKSVWFRSLKKLNKTSHCISYYQNVNIAMKPTTTKRQSYTVCEKENNWVVLACCGDSSKLKLMVIF